MDENIKEQSWKRKYLLMLQLFRSTSDLTMTSTAGNVIEVPKADNSNSLEQAKKLKNILNMRLKCLKMSFKSDSKIFEAQNSAHLIKLFNFTVLKSVNGWNLQNAHINCYSCDNFIVAQN